MIAGKGIFTIVNQNNRESYNVEKGDFLRIPAGAIAYAANQDNNRLLKIIKLAIPLNIPGQFEVIIIILYIFSICFPYLHMRIPVFYCSSCNLLV